MSRSFLTVLQHPYPHSARLHQKPYQRVRFLRISPEPLLSMLRSKDHPGSSWQCQSYTCHLCRHSSSHLWNRRSLYLLLCIQLPLTQPLLHKAARPITFSSYFFPPFCFTYMFLTLLYHDVITLLHICQQLFLHITIIFYEK